MAYQISADIQQLIDQRMATGRYDSPDHLLLEALHTLDDYERCVADIQEGIDDEAAGRTRSITEVDAEIRAEFGFAQ